MRVIYQTKQKYQRKVVFWREVHSCHLSVFSHCEGRTLFCPVIALKYLIHAVIATALTSHLHAISMLIHVLTSNTRAGPTTRRTVIGLALAFERSRVEKLLVREHGGSGGCRLLWGWQCRKSWQLKPQLATSGRPRKDNKMSFLIWSVG